MDSTHLALPTPPVDTPPPQQTGQDERPGKALGGRVLVVDDDQATCELLALSLGRQGHDVDWVLRGLDALAALERGVYEVVLSDLSMDAMSGLELCERVVAGDPDLPVVMVTGHGTMEKAVGAIRAGAYDFITKPFDMKALNLTVNRAIAHRRLRAEVRRLRGAVAESQRFEQLIGRSRRLRRLQDLITRIAPTDASILVTGESGTGKELVARAIHARSPRRDGPFVAINCAAVPAALIESELFGHAAGAFTDAKEERDGIFVQADGGTLFLDEIGELPLEMQPKLLRALQERVVRRVGGDEEIAFDARIVAATNRDLDEAIAEGDLREDLYYRLDVVRLDVPPLRERGGDVLLLAQHFVERYAASLGKAVHGIASPAAAALMAYDWPGNVRELENAMERAVALTRYDHVMREDLPEALRGRPSGGIEPAPSQQPEDLVSLAELEERYIRRVLAHVDGNKSRAARILGLDRRTLYRKLARYEEEAKR